MRIGANSGRCRKHLSGAFFGAAGPAEALVERARGGAAAGVARLQRFKISVKSIRAPDPRYRLLASKVPYPLHLGVTEAARRSGLDQGAVGMGALLVDGIGDTMRVSYRGSGRGGNASRGRF